MKYTRFLVVATGLGIVSMGLLELIRWQMPYHNPIVQGCLATVIYLAGVFVNFHLQRDWVFATSRQASLPVYTLWMITSACLVGLVAGVTFDVLQDFWPGMVLLSSASYALALALVSPLTFFGVSAIMADKP